jgi:hypothetical protein
VPRYKESGLLRLMERVYDFTSSSSLSQDVNTKPIARAIKANDKTFFIVVIVNKLLNPGSFITCLAGLLTYPGLSAFPALRPVALVVMDIPF